LVVVIVVDEFTLWGDIVGGELTLFLGGMLEDLVLEAWVGSIVGGIGTTLS
jgi:hypothetical protein